MRPLCVLVTDGDGSLNHYFKGSEGGRTLVRPRHRRGWESQQRARRLPGHGRRVRPRHRRGWESQLLVNASVRDADAECVLVTDGDGSLNKSLAALAESKGAVRPRHRRGWESQQLVGHDAIAGVLGASSSPTGMGVSTTRAECRGWCELACVLVTDGDGSLNLRLRDMLRHPVRCVLVTDGDGSLNGPKTWAAAWTARASSSPTGMGVSTSSPPASSVGGVVCVLVTDGDGSLNIAKRSTATYCGPCVLVTDGDGSLNTVAPDMIAQDAGCVLVTDGDGSLNKGMGKIAAGALGVRPRHRRGWESQQLDALDVTDEDIGASSSPTGMGVSTARTAAI